MLSVQRQLVQLSFGYAVPGLEGVKITDERLSATFDAAKRFLGVQAASQMPAVPAQRKLGRAEVDELLDVVELGEAQYRMRRKAGVGVPEDGPRPSRRSALELETPAGDVAPAARPTQQALQSKGGALGAFGAAGAGPSRPSAAGESAGLAREPAAPAETPAPSPVAAPTEPAPEVPSVQMRIAAEQSQAGDEERAANESPEAPGGRPRSARDEREHRLAEAKKPKQPGPLVAATDPERYARTYRVRFEFHAVDGPGGVAASLAEEDAAARMVEEPPVAAEAAEELPAVAEPAAPEQP